MRIVLKIVDNIITEIVCDRHANVISLNYDKKEVKLLKITSGGVDPMLDRARRDFQEKLEEEVGEKPPNEPQTTV